MEIQTYNKHIIDENYTPEVIDFGNKIHKELQKIGGIKGINLENRKKFGLILWADTRNIDIEINKLNKSYENGEITEKYRTDKINLLNNTKDLYLLPYYLHKEIDPATQDIYTISGEKLKHKDDVDLDHRYGLLAYGIILKK